MAVLDAPAICLCHSLVTNAQIREVPFPDRERSPLLPIAAAFAERLRRPARTDRFHPATGTLLDVRRPRCGVGCLALLSAPVALIA